MLWRHALMSRNMILNLHCILLFKVFEIVVPFSSTSFLCIEYWKHRKMCRAWCRTMEIITVLELKIKLELYMILYVQYLLFYHILIWKVRQYRIFRYMHMLYQHCICSSGQKHVAYMHHAPLQLNACGIHTFNATSQPYLRPLYTERSGLL